MFLAVKLLILAGLVSAILVVCGRIGVGTRESRRRRFRLILLLATWVMFVLSVDESRFERPDRFATGLLIWAVASTAVVFFVGAGLDFCKICDAPFYRGYPYETRCRRCGAPLYKRPNR